METGQLKCNMRDINREIWSYYMSGSGESYQSEMENDSSKMSIMQDISQYLNEHITLKNITKIEKIKNNYIIELDYEIFSKYSNLEELDIMLRNKPNEALQILNMAFHIYLTRRNLEEFKELIPDDDDKGNEDKSKIILRIFNIQKIEIEMKMMNSKHIDKLIMIEGTVVRIGEIKPLMISSAFSCKKCSEITNVTFVDGLYKYPIKCEALDCRGRTFKPLHDYAKLKDWQKITVQEIIQLKDEQDKVKVPRTVEVNLIDDLVDECMPGDIVKIIGIVKIVKIDKETMRLKTDIRTGSKLGLLYIDAISIKKKHYKENEQDKYSEHLNSINDNNLLNVNVNVNGFTKNELNFINEFTKEANGNQLKYLVNSFCPSIYGHELIKAGILLSLVGGNTYRTSTSVKRGDINIIYIGDPGQGKSMILKAAAACANKSVFISGKTSTDAGLTASVVKDTLTGDYVFEAGAMVLANNGLCCIDEFDKMTLQHDALLEAMEKQEISIAKGGLVATLPSKTTVIAAANPVDGHYNFSKTLNENVKINDALLSRFDLVFIMVDTPDTALDEKISDHIASLHTNFEVNKEKLNEKRRIRYPSFVVGKVTIDKIKGKFIEKLKMTKDELISLDIIPMSLIRKYISYARKYIKPKLSEIAGKALQDYYLQLRENSINITSTPITIRQLESLIRIAEAKAKIELREEVTIEDAQDAIKLMKEVLHDKYCNKSGMLKTSIGSQRNNKNEIIRFLKALLMYSKEQNKKLLSTSEMCFVADEIVLQVENVRKLIYTLNESGDILKKGNDMYELNKSHLLEM